MGISLNPDHLKRYKDMALLLIKYGRSDITAQAGLDKVIRDSDRTVARENPKAEELPHDLEKLGPAFVKLGQFLSTRSDLLTGPYLDALSRLQDRAEQFPYERIEQIVTSELGLRISRAFLEFEQIPIAAASLAQVHRARLHDGRLVAVKVQRPNIREMIVKDLEALEDIVELLDRHTVLGKRYLLLETLEEFRRALMRELDFSIEAQHLRILGENLAEYKLIIVPQPVEQYTTSRVLTMDYIPGTKITELTPLRRLEINGNQLAEELFRAYLQQFLIDGFYHADPHPGNVVLTEDGRVALLDLGMVARLSESLQRKLLRLLLSIAESRSDEAVEYALEMGEKTSDFNEKQFRNRITELVTQYQKVTIKDLEVGRVVLEVFRMAAEGGVRFPSELAMLGKSLLNLDQIGRSLDPDFDPNAAIRRYASKLLRQKIRKSISTAGLYEMIMDTREFLQLLPKRVNKIMGSLAGNELIIHVNAIDEQYLMTGIQKIANRLTLGLILAAIIIGAALMMSVETEYRIFGYPGLAIIFFLLAVLGGAALAFSILFHDERTKKKSQGPRI